MARRIRDPNAPERIVEAAWRVVADQGVRGATVRDIATEAGVSTGFITHYFEDKRELMVAVLDHNNGRAAQRAVSATSGKRGLGALRLAAEAVLPIGAERRAEWQVWVACWIDAPPDTELARGLREGWAGLRALLRQFLEQAAADGELRDGVDVEEECERLVTMLGGFGWRAGVESPSRARSAAKRILASYMAELTEDRRENAA